MTRAVELETLARMYYMAIAAGRPAILSDEEVMGTIERFKSYGGVDAPFTRPVAAKKRARKVKTAPRKKKTTPRNKKTPPAGPAAPAAAT
jgi:L-fuculose-phosphate aldolase